jgi:hypothetical protein
VLVKKKNHQYKIKKMSNPNRCNSSNHSLSTAHQHHHSVETLTTVSSAATAPAPPPAPKYVSGRTSKLAFRSSLSDRRHYQHRRSTFNLAFLERSTTLQCESLSSQEALDPYASYSELSSLQQSQQPYKSIAEVTAAAVLNERMKRNSQYNLSIPFNANRRFTTAVDQQDKFFNVLQLANKASTHDHRKSFISLDRNRVDHIGSFSENNNFEESEQSSLNFNENK